MKGGWYKFIVIIKRSIVNDERKKKPCKSQCKKSEQNRFDYVLGKHLVSLGAHNFSYAYFLCSCKCTGNSEVSVIEACSDENDKSYSEFKI